MRPIDPPAGPDALAPNLTPSRDGVLLSWLEPDGDARHTLYIAQLDDERWTTPRRITSGEKFFANWADLPAVVESTGGRRYAHWLRKLGADTYAYGVELASASADDGNGGDDGWQPLGLLHPDDASPVEHGFVSYAPLEDGGVQAFWLDGREMAHGGPMQLRAALLGDAGPQAGTVLDDRVCECCSTDAATTSRGPVVAYRDRGPTEIRDVAVVRATGESWSAPAMIHDDGWEIHGCPVNGPAIAADGDRVAVAWFTAGSARPRVSVAFSDDAGASFGAPVVVDDARPLGRVDVALGPQGNAIVSWLGSTADGAEIRWRSVGSDGEPGPVRVVAATTPERSAGVPRMLRDGDDLVFAWVEDTEPSRLRVARVALDGA